MTHFDKLEKTYGITANEFYKAKQDYYRYCNTVDNPHFEVETAKRAFENLCNYFDALLRVSVDQSKVKELVYTSHGDRKDIVPRVGIFTETSHIQITMGLFQDFYLITEIVSPHNIKYMKDDFWRLLFELSTLGEFKFKEKAVPEKSDRNNYPHLFSKTGNFYKLLRNYFLYETGESREWGRSLELGFIEVNWKNSIDYNVLLDKVIRTVEIMYRLNFLLWKHDNKHVKF